MEVERLAWITVLDQLRHRQVAVPVAVGEHRAAGFAGNRHSAFSQGDAFSITRRTLYRVMSGNSNNMPGVSPIRGVIRIEGAISLLRIQIRMLSYSHSLTFAVKSERCANRPASAFAIVTQRSIDGAYTLAFRA